MPTDVEISRMHEKGGIRWLLFMILLYLGFFLHLIYENIPVPVRIKTLKENKENKFILETLLEQRIQHSKDIKKLRVALYKIATSGDTYHPSNISPNVEDIRKHAQDTLGWKEDRAHIIEDD